MSGYSLRTIAEKVGGELSGDPGVKIHGVRTVGEAGEGDISVIVDRRAVASLQATRASALIVPFNTETVGTNLIHVKDPRQALIQVLELFYPEQTREAVVDPRAVVSPLAQLGPGVHIAAGVCVEKNAVVGARVQIYPNVYIGEHVSIGDDSVVFPNVTIYPETKIGKRVRVHSGTVIGSDGFGYARDESGVYQKIPQVGSVEIGDDVEVGSNCTIDRATLGTTRIGSGTKIDNLVQVGHNSEIGRHCCIIAQVGISGSVRIGDFSVLAGQAGIRDHMKIEQGTVVGAQAGVMDDIGPGEWVGSPAIPADEARRIFVLWRKLPEFRNQIRALQKRCARLEELVEQLQREAGKPTDASK